MTSGDCIGLCLAREDGIQHWLDTMGPPDTVQAMKEAPNSLRARYGNPEHGMVNAVHGSDTPESSEREIEIVFPHILQGERADDGDRKGR